MTTFSKSLFIFVISMFEIGSEPTLRKSYAFWILGHLCHILCHFEHFGDNIFKIVVHIRNQHT